MDGSTPPTASIPTVIDLDKSPRARSPTSYIPSGFVPPGFVPWLPSQTTFPPSVNFGQMPVWGPRSTYPTPPHLNFPSNHSATPTAAQESAAFVGTQGGVQNEEPKPKKLRKSTKSTKKINLEDLTESQLEEAKLGGPWKEHWVLHLITLRGEMHDVFSGPPKQGVDNWSRLHLKLVSMCPDFNKDSEACRKKWGVIYKDYKLDKAINSISGSARSEKCKWYLMVDEYMSDRANVIPHAHGTAHEPDGILPTPIVKDAEDKLDNFKEKSTAKRKKEDSLLRECLDEVKTSGKLLVETMQNNEAAKLDLFRSMQETLSKLIDKV